MTTYRSRPSGVFLVYDVPSKDVRGEHAHKRCEQFLLCVRGSVGPCVVDDGTSREEIALDSPEWASTSRRWCGGSSTSTRPDAVLMVLGVGALRFRRTTCATTTSTWSCERAQPSLRDQTALG